MPDSPFEDELGAALRRTADTFEPDRPALVDAGLRQGRRRLFRRRALAVTGAAAALAVVGLGTQQLAGGPGRALEQSSVADRATASPSPRPVKTSESTLELKEKASPKPTSSSKGEFAGAEEWDGLTVDGDKVLATLKGALPEGRTTKEQGSDTGSASLVLDDGDGASLIRLSLSRVDPQGATARDLVACPSKSLVRFDSCRTDTLADGSRVQLFQGYDYGDERANAKNWSVAVVTPEGYAITVGAYNAAEEKLGTVTRPEPPLTTAELKGIALLPAWDELLSGSDPADPETPSPGEMPEKAVAEVLASLLPKGIILANSGMAQSGYASYVIDEGEGGSLIGVNVQPGYVGDHHSRAEAKTQLYASAETLPDGTLVQESKGPGEKGGKGVVEWKVDVLRPNGDRVVVAEYNASTQHTSATRETPLHSMAELRQIALSERWGELG
ncbi:hypothetical protein [Streptomyces sp. NPDC060194]|uniref:hypothetical protein n=1 Tax=Streptomyces sp. NPDC060194 TaxID=3347069 RepID=UPI00366357AC